MEYHFLLNGQRVEIATSKLVSDRLRDVFVEDICLIVDDTKDNLQAIVTAAWKAFIANLPDA